MKAYLINMHLLVPRSRSTAKGKVKYKGYISQKIAISGSFVFHKHILFLAPLAIGQRAYVMVCCPSWVRVLTFSLNIFFSETTNRILMKFHRNVLDMVLFIIFLKNLIPSKTLVAMATKLNFL